MVRFRLALLALLPAALAAQAGPPAAGRVRGLVIDSLVVGGPLAGATVWVQGHAAEATTDAAGRFELRDLPAGTWTLALQADTLTAHELPTAVARVTVPDSGDVFVIVATPSARTLYRRSCGRDPDGGTGALVGVVGDAERDLALEGATVVARWIEWTVARGGAGLRQDVREARARAGADGRFVLCALPSGIDLETTASARGHAAGAVDVNLGGRAIAVRRLAVSLADPAASGASGAVGTAAVAGTVRGARGERVVGARVRVAGTERWMYTDSSGAFYLAGVPAGSQTVEARAIGYAPVRHAATLRTGTTARVAVTLVEAAQALPSVAVMARRAGTRDISGFDARRARGLGRYVTRAEIERRRALDATDLLRMLPGVDIVSRGAGKGALTLRRGGRSCLPDVYVDGMPFPEGALSFDDLVHPNEIEGIEVYSGASASPVKFAHVTNACGLVLVWTRDQ